MYVWLNACVYAEYAWIDFELVNSEKKNGQDIFLANSLEQ